MRWYEGSQAKRPCQLNKFCALRPLSGVFCKRHTVLFSSAYSTLKTANLQTQPTTFLNLRARPRSAVARRAITFSQLWVGSPWWVDSEQGAPSHPVADALCACLQRLFAVPCCVKHMNTTDSSSSEELGLSGSGSLGRPPRVKAKQLQPYVHTRTSNLQVNVQLCSTWPTNPPAERSASDFCSCQE